MKGLARLASVAVLLVACGSSAVTQVHGNQPLKAVVAVHRKPSVKAIAASRERAAAREAKALLHRFVPPPGATRTRPPRPYKGFDLSSIGSMIPADELVAGASQVWRTTMSFADLVAYVQAHRPAGFSGGVGGYSTDDPTYNPQWEDFSYYQHESRFIDVAITHFPDGRVVIQVAAAVEWTYPRSRDQMVPSATREIDVRAHHSSVRVTDRREVKQIVHWFAALPITHLDNGFGCNANIGFPIPTVDFVFRSETGVRLASASAPVYSANHCDPIVFGIQGEQTGTLFADRFSGPGLAHRVGKLLGLRLTS